jgi:sporulation protein YlmC with PRC-barrel domain
MQAGGGGRRWLGLRVDDAREARVGTVEDVYVDCESGLPRWLLVRVGRLRASHTLVPLPNEGANGSRVSVPYPRDLIRRAPPVARGAALSQARELALCTHYGLMSERGAEIDSLSSRDLTAVPASAASVRAPSRAALT